MAGLLFMCALVIIGIKSRVVALLLALLMAASACWKHPFWVYAFSTKVGASRRGPHGSTPPHPPNPMGHPN